MARRIPFAIAVAVSVAVTACYAPSMPFGVPCGQDADCPSRQTCDPDELVCGPPSEARSWRDDAAADFGAEGAYVDEVTLEAAGFVGPVGYLPGGLRISGIDSLVLRDPLTPWNEIAAAPRTGASLSRGLDLSFGNPRPPGLGLSDEDSTIVIEGEILLDAAGMWRFQLTADDLGFLELAPPGSPDFVRVVTDETTTTNASYMVVTPGWHRIRGAFAEDTGDMGYEVRVDRPGQPTQFRDVGPDELRARAGDLGGVLVDGFEEPYLIGARASVVHAGTLAGQTFGSAPFGLPVGTGAFSLRYAGQVLIDAGGDHAFRIDSGQGHRAWIDGALVADSFDTAPAVTVTPRIPLEPGWHDLVVDMHRFNGGPPARLDVTISEGPGGPGEIPADHLRPIVGRKTRWAAAYAEPLAAIPENGSGSVTRSVTLALPAGLTPTRIDAMFEIDHPDLPTVEVQLDPPVGATTPIAPAGSLPGTGSYSHHALVPVGNAGATWGFIATDAAADGLTGELTSIAVTMIGAGGPAPFPASYRYISAPRDLGDVASVTHVRWALRQASPDAPARVSLRTCDDAAACDAEPWTEVADGVRPGVPPRRFAQYMIELTSDGDVPTALDWIEIGYRGYLEQ